VLFELFVIGNASFEVHAVDFPNSLDRGAGFVLEDVFRRCAVQNDVFGIERMLKSNTIEVLTVPQDGLTLAVRGVKRLVFSEDLFRTRVQAKVHGSTVKMSFEVVVFVFTLLPTGRNRGNAAFDAELRHGFGERRIEALRSQQDDSPRLARDHSARTLSVRPTVSSIERKLS
jgi:hypothetical protein